MSDYQASAATCLLGSEQPAGQEAIDLTTIQFCVGLFLQEIVNKVGEWPHYWVERYQGSMRFAMPVKDQTLVRRAQQGQERAFRQLVERYQERIYNVCYRVAGNAEDAEDAALETFMGCYRSLSNFEGKSSFATWIYRIAVRTAWKFRQRRPGNTVPIDGMDLPEGRLTAHPERQLQESEIQQAIESAIARLPEPLQAVVILHFVEGLSYRAIADILECPIGTVGSRIHLARGQLQQWLNPLVEE